MNPEEFGFGLRHRMILLIEENNQHLKLFLNGYSYVACDNGDVIGLILSYPIPSLKSGMVFVDSLVVAKHARGNGIARKLIDIVKKSALENRIYCLQLMTDNEKTAYQMYRHLGFKESKYVLMSKW